VGGIATDWPWPSVARLPLSVVKDVSVVRVLDEHSGVATVDVSLTVGKGTVKGASPPIPPHALIIDRALASDVQVIKVPFVLTEGRAKHFSSSEHLSSLHVAPRHSATEPLIQASCPEVHESVRLRLANSAFRAWAD